MCVSPQAECSPRSGCGVVLMEMELFLPGASPLLGMMVLRVEGAPHLPQVPPPCPCQPPVPPSHPVLLPLVTSRSELRPGEIIAPPGPPQVGSGIVPVPSCPWGYFSPLGLVLFRTSYLKP